MSWADLDRVSPGDFTVHTTLGMLGEADRWAQSMPAPQRLPADLVAEGHEIPVARVRDA